MAKLSINRDLKLLSECGINVENFIILRGSSHANVLRPEPPTPPSSIIEISASRPARSLPSGSVPAHGGVVIKEGLGGINTKSAWPWMV